MSNFFINKSASSMDNLFPYFDIIETVPEQSWIIVSSFDDTVAFSGIVTFKDVPILASEIKSIRKLAETSFELEIYTMISFEKLARCAQ